MKKFLYFHLVFLFANNVLAVEFKQITYESFKQEYLNDWESRGLDKLVQAIVNVVENKEGKAVVWKVFYKDKVVRRVLMRFLASAHPTGYDNFSSKRRCDEE